MLLLSEAQDMNGMQQPDGVQEWVGMQVLDWVQGLIGMDLCQVGLVELDCVPVLSGAEWLVISDHCGV